MYVDVTFALLLTTLAGLATGIGSAIGYFIRTPRYSYLAVMLGFSAGVMVYISFAELLKTAIDQVGFGTANLAFFIGIAFIGLVDMLIPHEYEEERFENTESPAAAENEARREGRAKRWLLPGPGRAALQMRAGPFPAQGLAQHK